MPMLQQSLVPINPGAAEQLAYAHMHTCCRSMSLLQWKRLTGRVILFCRAVLPAHCVRVVKDEAEGQEVMKLG